MDPVTIIAGLIAVGTAVAKGVSVAKVSAEQQKLINDQIRDQQKALRIYKMEVLPASNLVHQNEMEIAAAKQVFTQEMAGVGIAIALTGAVLFVVSRKK